MVKKVIILGLTLVSAAVAQAQKGSSNIDVTAGLAIPVSDYASTSSSNDKAGAATVGGTIGANYRYQFHDYLGFVGGISYLANGMDAQPLVDELKKNYSTIKWTVEATSWKLLRFQFGLYGVLPIDANKKISLEPYLLLGIASAYSPELTITGTYSYASTSGKQNEANTSAFTYSTGINLRGYVTETVSLFGGIDYNTANCSFKDIKIEVLGRTQTISQDMTISNLTLRAGVGFKIN